jgi:DtxR family manganese transport transcriptional regulator
MAKRSFKPRRAAQEGPARRAAAFRASRDHHKAETAEDYVELIHDLILESGEARSVDLAKRLGVSHVTVAKTVQRLRKDGLVRYEPYRSIFLTDSGQSLAQRCQRRHQEVVAFLRALGVSPFAAEIDAEGIEHHVSDETLNAMRQYVGGRRKAKGR